MQSILDFSKVAEVQLSYVTNVKPSDRPQITSSKQAYDVLINHWDRSQIEFVEEFKILLLNRANKVLGIVPISKGGTSATVADPKLIFVSAIKSNASGIVLAHNHPSGNLKPSTADIALTKKIAEGGRLLDVPVIDHLIVTNNGYYSFADEGAL